MIFTMRSIFLCIFLFLFLVYLSVEVQCSKEEVALYRTTRDAAGCVACAPLLLAAREKRPKALIVRMRVFLQQILNIDSQYQTLEVNAWLKYIWTDYRLRWNPRDHDNITSLRFMGGDEAQLWQPDILLYNSVVFDNEIRFDSTYKTNMVVYHTGEVNWIPPGIFKIACKIDITMFPFDEQMCALKFGSWTYNGFAIDLQIDPDSKTEPTADLSTFISNGEWHLLHAPAQREEHFYKCCPEPYPTIKFFIHIRRRTLYYMFNIIIPSFLISLMTLMVFCLPATDMSEKIGYQTTILLSVCFFLTMLSEMIPTTSDSLPLLGIFFSTLTFIISISTVFTIAVLNIRYRQIGNHAMSPIFRHVFVEFIPWLMLMRRPGHRYRKAKDIDMSLPRDDQCVQCAARDHCDCGGSMSTSMEWHNEPHLDPILPQLYQYPGERLGLQRKVGEGLFMAKKVDNERKRQETRYERLMRKYKLLTAMDDSESVLYFRSILGLYDSINDRLKEIRRNCDRKKRKESETEDWKFAAMALDRLCLSVFTTFFILCLTTIFLSAPRIEIN